MRSRDGGWAWLVLLASFGHLFIVGLPYSIGMYVNELIVELNLDHTTAGLFGALQLASLHVGGVFTCLSERYTHRVVIFTAGVVASVALVVSIYTYNIYVLFVTFSILPGLCVGIMFLQSMIIMNRYFHRYASIANGITLSGSGLGFMIMPYICDVIIDVYGWRHSLYIVAGITLQGSMLAMLLRPISVLNPDRISMKSDAIHTKLDTIRTKSQSQEIITSSQSSPTRKTLFVDPQFYMFLICNTFWATSASSVYVLGPNLFYERGMTNGQISIIMAVNGVGNLCTRILYACALHFRSWNVVVMHAINLSAMGVTVAAFVLYDTFIYYIVVSFMFGVTFATTAVTQALVPRALGGLQHYGTVYSCAIGCCVMGFTSGPPLSGYIFDSTKSYVVAFITNCSIAVFGAILMVVGVLLKWWQNRPSHKRDTCNTTEYTLEVPCIDTDDKRLVENETETSKRSDIPRETKGLLTDAISD